MKTQLLIVSVLLALCGPAFAAEKQKTFNIVVDPPDAAVRVVSGAEQREQRYRAPASITAAVPQDPELARKAVVEITRDRYKPVVIALRSIRDGELLRVKLEKVARNHFTFASASPSQSPELRIRDASLAMNLAVEEQQLQVSIANLSAQTIGIVWQRAQYTDVDGRPHRLMPAGVRPEDRNLPFSVQTMLPGITLHQALTPVDHISFSRGTKSFETRPLFAMNDAARLNGKVFGVLIPVNINGRVVSYEFKVKITGVAQD